MNSDLSLSKVIRDCAKVYSTGTMIVDLEINVKSQANSINSSSYPVYANISVLFK